MKNLLKIALRIFLAALLFLPVEMFSVLVEKEIVEVQKVVEVENIEELRAELIKRLEDLGPYENTTQIMQEIGKSTRIDSLKEISKKISDLYVGILKNNALKILDNIESSEGKEELKQKINDSNSREALEEIIQALQQQLEEEQNKQAIETLRLTALSIREDVSFMSKQAGMDTDVDFNPRIDEINKFTQIKNFETAINHLRNLKIARSKDLIEANKEKDAKISKLKLETEEIEKYIEKSDGEKDKLNAYIDQQQEIIKSENLENTEKREALAKQEAELAQAMAKIEQMRTEAIQAQEASVDLDQGKQQQLQTKLEEFTKQLEEQGTKLVQQKQQLETQNEIIKKGEASAEELLVEKEKTETATNRAESLAKNMQKLEAKLKQQQEYFNRFRSSTSIRSQLTSRQLTAELIKRDKLIDNQKRLLKKDENQEKLEDELEKQKLDAALLALQQDIEEQVQERSQKMEKLTESAEDLMSKTKEINESLVQRNQDVARLAKEKNELASTLSQQKESEDFRLSEGINQAKFELQNKVKTLEASLQQTDAEKQKLEKDFQSAQNKFNTAQRGLSAANARAVNFQQRAVGQSSALKQQAQALLAKQKEESEKEIEQLNKEFGNEIKLAEEKLSSLGTQLEESQKELTGLEDSQVNFLEEKTKFAASEQENQQAIAQLKHEQDLSNVQKEQEIKEHISLATQLKSELEKQKSIQAALRTKIAAQSNQFRANAQQTQNQLLSMSAGFKQQAAMLASKKDEEKAKELQTANIKWQNKFSDLEKEFSAKVGQVTSRLSQSQNNFDGFLGDLKKEQEVVANFSEKLNSLNRELQASKGLKSEVAQQSAKLQRLVAKIDVDSSNLQRLKDELRLAKNSSHGLEKKHKTVTKKLLENTQRSYQVELAKLKVANDGLKKTLQNNEEQSSKLLEQEVIQQKALDGLRERALRLKEQLR
jgi:hypothetical protein